MSGTPYIVSSAINSGIQIMTPAEAPEPTVAPVTIFTPTALSTGTVYGFVSSGDASSFVAECISTATQLNALLAALKASGVIASS